MFESSLQFYASQLALGLALAALIAATAWRLGALSTSGTVAATLVGGLTYGIGGLPAAILLIVFFGSSSLLSRAFARRKRGMAANFAKGRRRDWAQVAANGGMAVLVLAAGATGWLSNSMAWAAFAAALATVNADTWATELGVLSAGRPHLITTGKLVSHGTSGGVSLLGSTVALAAAFVIGLLAWLLVRSASPAIIVIVALAGLLGSFIDSYLGASVQAIYYCPKCKKETERHPLHSCGTKTSLRRGWPWLDNDWVNFFSSVAGSLLALGAVTLFL